MPDQVIHVPVALLLNPDLPASAKLAWMVASLRLAAAHSGTVRLAITSAISRPAMSRGMARLAAAGWHPGQAKHSGLTVPMPASLLTNRQLGIEARVLYGILLLTPGFDHPSGRFTYAGLASLAQVTQPTAIKAIRDLTAAEWIKTTQENRLAPVHFELTFPGFEREVMAMAGSQFRLELADYRGEQLMREYLSLLVDLTEFEDDAAPGFLVNPRTDQRLQFDRYYPPNVAWEFNGPQHYHETEQFSMEQVVRQQERDYIKAGICALRQITLVIVEPKDLSLAGIRAKIGNLLPVRDIAGYQLLADYLEEESLGYRRKLARLERRLQAKRQEDAGPGGCR